MTLSQFAETVASNAPDTQVFAAAAALAANSIGHDLFTMMRLHRSTMEVERLYSSRPEAYPVGGRKPKKDTPWGHQVLTEGNIFTGGETEIRAVFTDHAIITRLGLRYVANVPIRVRGKTFGTINLLSGSVVYRDGDLGNIRIIAGLLVGRLSINDSVTEV